MAYHCSDKVIGNVDLWFSLSCAVCIYELLSKYPLFEDDCIEMYTIRINIIFWYISSHLTMLSLCSGCLLFVFTRPLQSENLLALIGSHCADATFAQMWVIAFQCHARYQSDWFHSLLSDPKLVGKMMCRKKGSSFISSLSCRKRLVITFLTAWHLIFWSWYPLNSWLTNMTGIWKTRNGISLLSTEIHDFGLCLYDVKLYLGKRVDMLTSRMKSIWISFDCDQASHSAVVLWDVQWAEAPHADAQRNHPLHPSPPRITHLKRPFSPMFGACHPSKPKNSSFHITRTVMYLFPKLHRNSGQFLDEGMEMSKKHHR